MQNEFFSEDHRRTFADFEELKPFLREVVEFYNTGIDIPTAEKEHDYEQILKVWGAVIDRSYKTVPYGTTDKWIENRINPSADSSKDLSLKEFMADTAMIQFTVTDGAPDRDLVFYVKEYEPADDEDDADLTEFEDPDAFAMLIESLLD